MAFPPSQTNSLGQFGQYHPALMKEKCKSKQQTRYGTAPGVKELCAQGEVSCWAGHGEGSSHLAPDTIVHWVPHQEILSLHLKEGVHKADLFFLVLWRHGIIVIYRFFKQKDQLSWLCICYSLYQKSIVRLEGEARKTPKRNLEFHNILIGLRSLYQG